MLLEMSSYDETAHAAEPAGSGRHLEQDGAPEPDQTARSLIDAVAPSPRMIIVEDAPLIALDLAETMKDLGFDVRATAFTHEQALAEIAQSVPDFAVIDLRLGMAGDGRGGESLLSVLSARGCRCLVFSGDEDAIRRVAEDYPQVSVLSKPAQPGMLAREIERLRRRPAA
jgi:ActR/RegA family two-component response regulator